MKIIFIICIKLYKYTLSPFLGQNCRFTPSCSSYSIEAFNKYNILKACFLSINRIRKCHPWNPGGFDPLK
ncbi:MAG: membrane protein insertion efficiency factor YidD [Bdellovibrionales bacterium]|jgi:uncharacterized protein|nr:membrane protein insertion efficiency factor YidD [Bdellovibrionales bacterium]